MIIVGHRLGYSDLYPSQAKDGKAYIRLNGGSWVAVTNSNFEMAAKERAYGGIGGGYHTNKLGIQLSRLVGQSALPEVNTLEFRMGATDGVTNGFRILHFEIRGSGSSNLIVNPYQQDNPGAWQAPLLNASDLNEGRRLFEARSSLVDRGQAIMASCKDCHTEGGRDLDYFAYSNGSIVARSKFHGLTYQQGLQIASYIRGNVSRGVRRYGRPRNPPYQPGPGLDDLPVERWASGTGLNWVLASDEQTKPYLLPNGDSRSQFTNLIKSGHNSTIGQINTREIPVAIQLPDWNAWLPAVHPIDIWGDYYSQFMETPSHGFDAMKARASEAISQGRMGYDSQNTAGFYLERLTNDAYRFMRNEAIEQDYPLRVSRGRILDERRISASKELINNAMAKTIAVKTFDAMTSLRLEDKAKTIYGQNLAEKRQWPVRKFSVFQVAPHMHANNRNHFTSSDLRQSRVKGIVDSVAWYHLQIVLNSGGKVRQMIYPVDWDYQCFFLNKAARDTGINTPYLDMLTLIKGFQSNTTPFGIGAKGFMIRFTKPHWALNTSIARLPNQQTRKNFMDAFVSNYIDTMQTTYGVMQWSANRFVDESVNPGIMWNNLLSQDAEPGPFASGQSFHNNHANNAYVFSQITSQQRLLSNDVMHRYLSLVKNLWPRGEFEQFSPFGKTIRRISRNTTFEKGDSVDTRLFRLVFQDDGNLVLYRKSSSTAVWSTQSGGTGERAVYGSDGNLVVYDWDDKAVYESRTTHTGSMVLSDLNGLGIGSVLLSRTLSSSSGFPIRRGSVFRAGRFNLDFQADGNLVASDMRGNVLWHSETAVQAEL